MFRSDWGSGPTRMTGMLVTALIEFGMLWNRPFRLNLMYRGSLAPKQLCVRTTINNGFLFSDVLDVLSSVVSRI